MSVSEAMEISQKESITEALEWLAACTPSDISKMGPTTFKWTTVSPGDALFIPMAHFIMEKACDKVISEIYIAHA